MNELDLSASIELLPAYIRAKAAFEESLEAAAYRLITNELDKITKILLKKLVKLDIDHSSHDCYNSNNACRCRPNITWAVNSESTTFWFESEDIYSVNPKVYYGCHQSYINQEIAVEVWKIYTQPRNLTVSNIDEECFTKTLEAVIAAETRKVNDRLLAEHNKQLAIKQDKEYQEFLKLKEKYGDK